VSQSNKLMSRRGIPQPAFFLSRRNWSTSVSVRWFQMMSRAGGEVYRGRRCRKRHSCQGDPEVSPDESCSDNINDMGSQWQLIPVSKTLLIPCFSIQKWHIFTNVNKNNGTYNKVCKNHLNHLNYDIFYYYVLWCF